MKNNFKLTLIYINLVNYKAETQLGQHFNYVKLKSHTYCTKSVELDKFISLSNF